jgi:hypothetical protein
MGRHSGDGLPHRRASNVLWLIAAGVLTGSLVAASLSCSFWDNLGAYLAAGPVAVAAMFAVYLRQSDAETTLGLLFPVSVGIAAGFGTFYGVVASSLAFGHCG